MRGLRSAARPAVALRFAVLLEEGELALGERDRVADLLGLLRVEDVRGDCLGGGLGGSVDSISIGSM